MNEGSPKDRSKRTPLEKTGSPKVIKRPEVRSRKPEEDNNSAIDIPHSEIKELQTANSILFQRNSLEQTEQMEVHHHPDLHHEKKAWKEYFLEFLMIFLAVTMGFFAESLREHITEKNNATELARSFYNELKRDSATIQTIQMHRLRRDSSLRYLRKYFRDSSIANCSKKFSVNFMYGLEVFSPYVFEPKDGILNQLKNSGSLRYFKSIELQKLTGDLSGAITNIRTRNEYESNYLDLHLLPFLVKHNDMDFFDKVCSRYNFYLFTTAEQYEKSKEAFPFHFNKPKEFDKVESMNMLGSYQMICWGSSVRQYADYQKLNVQLIKELRKEYHPDDE
jgi:hypothetical protein